MSFIHDEFQVLNNYEADRASLHKKIMVQSLQVIGVALFIGTTLYIAANYEEETQDLKGRCFVLVKYCEFCSIMFLLAAGIRFILFMYTMMFSCCKGHMYTLHLAIQKLSIAETLSVFLFFLIGCFLTQIQEQCAIFGFVVLILLIIGFVAGFFCYTDEDLIFQSLEFFYIY